MYFNQTLFIAIMLISNIKVGLMTTFDSSYELGVA